jgi:putative ABC transport system permease protein
LSGILPFFLSMRKNSIIFENLKISLSAIRTNMLRSILTICIIAIGIWALVGILTALDAIKSSLGNSLALMGANTFSIGSRGMEVHIGDQHKRNKNYSYISYKQAERFKTEFSFPAAVSISVNASQIATVKAGIEKTDPNVPVMGVDENYLQTAGYDILKGRNLTADEIRLNKNYAVIGGELSRKLFKNDADPLDKIITVGGGKYKVVGVLKDKGSSFGMSNDKIVLLPYTNVRQYFSRPNMNYNINVIPNNPNFMEAAVGEAEGLFRIIRGLAVTDESDFNITQSDSLSRMLIDSMANVSYAATIIGLITLFGAAIGLMNIMLVSVTERTSEIGIRKAIGAKSTSIKQQFLFESILIGQFGGILGIFLGIITGNVLGLALKTSFIIPWIWIFMGVILCLFVGFVSGYFPAVKAAKVDPIISLHYE